MTHRIVIREALHQKLENHLLSGFQHGQRQEEVCFGLWRRGDGLNRYTGILGEDGRPPYPFLEDKRTGWRDRFRSLCRRVRMRMGRLATAILD